MTQTLAYDVEATGVDLWNGCLPYMFQFHGYHPLDHDPDMPNLLRRFTHTDAAEVQCPLDWTLVITFPVDPYTRLPEYNLEELAAIDYLLFNYPIVAHNAKFDIRATEQAFEYFAFQFPNDAPDFLTHHYQWDWSNIYDTIHYCHAFRNFWGMSLKNFRKILWCVGDKLQNNMRDAVNHARRIVRKKEFIAEHGNWRIADSCDPHWPATDRAPKEKDEDVSGWWWYDTWLPRAIAERAPEWLPAIKAPESYRGYTDDYYRPEDHPWHNVSQLYGEEDVLTTLPLLFLLIEIVGEEGNLDLVEQRHELLEVTYDMESLGIPLNDTIESEIERYATERDGYAANCMEIANRWYTNSEGSTEFSLTSNNALRKLLYEDFELKPPAKTETGLPTLKEEHLKTLAEKTEEQDFRDFINYLLLSRKNEKSRNTLHAYLQRSRNECFAGAYWANVMHGNYNITGTKFLRQSSSNPNLQNISTGEGAEKAVVDEYLEAVLAELGIQYNLREQIGPQKGYQIFSLDYQSIEFFIWAFSCGNQEVQDCYYQGISPFKPVMEAVWGFFDKDAPEYKPTKNGIYSRIYGSGEANSDHTFKKRGAVKAIEGRMPEVRKFTRFLHNKVKKDGYIETLAGYPLRIPLDEPHKAVSAFVQGHAGWVIGQAMILCHHYLKRLNENRYEPVNLLLQVHDELNFHGPESFEHETGLKTEELVEIINKAHDHHVASDLTPVSAGGTSKVTLVDYLGTSIGEQLIGLMRLAGEKYGIPTPVNASLFTKNWGNGVEVTEDILVPF